MKKYAYYDFGRNTKFKNYIWVKGKATFFNPHYINFEKATNQPITVEIYDHNYTFQGMIEFPKGYHWQSADLTWLPRSKQYRFKLVNKGSGTVHLLQGQIGYEHLIIA